MVCLIKTKNMSRAKEIYGEVVEKEVTEVMELTEQVGEQGEVVVATLEQIVFLTGVGQPDEHRVLGQLRSQELVEKAANGRRMAPVGQHPLAKKLAVEVEGEMERP